MKNRTSLEKKTKNTWHKFLPYLPIIGIPLTIIYEVKYQDTGIKNNNNSRISAFVQAISIIILLYIIN